MRAPAKLELLQGTLDMLILRTLIFGPAHGRGIAKHIRQTTDGVLSVEHGSLYPALHRLEKAGWIAGKWDTGPGVNREFKYYRLTAAGRKRLLQQQSRWDQFVEAITRVMLPVEG
jgi:PadR family transcriptional regulator PadR